MALKVLMLRKKLNDARKALDELRAKDAEFETREAELAADIEAAQTEEEQTAVEEAVTGFDTEKAEHADKVSELERTVADLENEISGMEQEQETEPAKPAPVEERKENKNMDIRSIDNIVTRDDVKAYLGEVRAAIKEKRALTNVGLTIPEVMLGMIRENIEGYSKLYKHVNVRPVAGQARQLIMGTVPEAIWTDCCANLNELTLTFNDLEMDCYKVGGYFAVCNANLEDSDVALATELMTALGQAIGLALDKAILYGRNAAGAMKMPQGIVARLAQESQPAGYPATARPWADLHTSNIKTIANSVTGAALFAAIVTNFGAAKGKYSRGEKVFVMNETTYAYLMAQAMSINAAGAVVTGLNGTMPVLGGAIELLSFVPDYVIVGGYFDNYTLAERAGQAFATSEHVRFMQDQTVFKGTARYDGAPAIAEAFVAIGVNGTTPTATMTFGADDANDVKSIALNTATLAITGTGTAQLIAITAPGSGAVTWASSASGKATVDSNGLVTGVTSGTTTITATANGLTASCVVTVS